MLVGERSAGRSMRRLARTLGAVVAWDTWAATGYLLATLPLGVLWFTVSVTGLVAGIVTGPFWVGLPILFLSTVVWRAGARTQRALLRGALGIDIPDPYRPRPAGSLLSRFRARLTDSTTWRDFAYLVLLLPLGCLWVGLVATIWGVPLALLSTPLWYRLVPGHVALVQTGPDLNLFGPLQKRHALLVVDTTPKALLVAAIGLVLCLAAAHLVRGLAAVHGMIARGLLGPTSRAEVEEQRAKRAKAVDVAAAERRRIERDLHDGAQQRLVALALDLGMARQQLAGDPDPEAVRALVVQAHDEAKRALAELRNLARGIHPAVLTDRGLDAAISALAARSPVPVEVDVGSLGRSERPPAAVESTAYFVVAEALANVAKHAAATRAEVRIAWEGERLVVQVLDDGVGGADPARGSGLAGLSDRVAAVDGRLTVTSPKGGPTVIRAELPCAS